MIPAILTLMCYPVAVALLALVAVRPDDPRRGVYFIAALLCMFAPLVIITVAQL